MRAKQKHLLWAGMLALLIIGVMETAGGLVSPASLAYADTCESTPIYATVEE